MENSQLLQIAKDFGSPVYVYDADKIEEAASCHESELIQKQLDILMDPNDPKVIEKIVKEEK